MKTKILCVMLCLVALLSLCGCQSGQTQTESGTNSQHTDLENRVPNVYKDILTDYEKVLAFRLSDTFENDYNDGKNIMLSDGIMSELTDSMKYRWSAMLVEMVPGGEKPERSDFGYVLKDVNKDGNPELFWVRKDHTILAVFTTKNDQAKLIDAFWSRYAGVISDDGKLYTKESGGAVDTGYTISEMNVDGSGLTTVKEFGVSDADYYEVIDGNRTTVNEDRFYALLSEYPFQTNSDWEIISMD